MRTASKGDKDTSAMANTWTCAEKTARLRIYPCIKSVLEVIADNKESTFVESTGMPMSTDLYFPSSGKHRKAHCTKNVLRQSLLEVIT